MKENQSANKAVTGKQPQVPQFQVRTDLRGGESVEACMNNLQYWQNEYYKWYEQAKYKHV